MRLIVIYRFETTTLNQVVHIHAILNNESSFFSPFDCKRDPQTCIEENREQYE